MIKSNQIRYKGPTWNQARPKIREKFEEAGILNVCELHYDGCIGTALPLTFAHSLHRKFISIKEEMETVCRACSHCHKILDSNKHDVTEQIVLDVIANRAIPVKSIYEKKDRNSRRV